MIGFKAARVGAVAAGAGDDLVGDGGDGSGGGDGGGQLLRGFGGKDQADIGIIIGGKAGRTPIGRIAQDGGAAFHAGHEGQGEAGEAMGAVGPRQAKLDKAGR